MNQSDEKFAVNIQQQLSDSLNDIDTDVLNRLRQARTLAVNAARQKESRNTDIISLAFPQWLAPASTATAFATIAFVAITVWTQPAFLTTPLTPTIIEDIAVLSSSDDLDLYENLDFYIWLEHEDSTS